MSTRTKCSKFLRCKWVLPSVIVILILAATSLHPFLAVNKPVGHGILVVEAWVPPKTLAESANLFNSGNYCCIVIVGGTIRGIERYSTHLTTYPDLAAKRLEELGFDTKKLVRISAPDVAIGRRTLTSAMAIKRWLNNSGASVCCLDVFTAGVHARKSWLLFRYALGDSFRVGIIAGDAAPYNRAVWFLSPRGIWSVSHNLAGYVYSKLWMFYNDAMSTRLTPPS